MEMCGLTGSAGDFVLAVLAWLGIRFRRNVAFWKDLDRSDFLARLLPACGHTYSDRRFQSFWDHSGSLGRSGFLKRFWPACCHTFAEQYFESGLGLGASLGCLVFWCTSGQHAARLARISISRTIQALARSGRPGLLCQLWTACGQTCLEWVFESCLGLGGSLGRSGLLGCFLLASGQTHSVLCFECYLGPGLYLWQM
jgi:hypothetical protein